MGGRMCRICIPRRREEPLRRISAWIRKKEKPVSAWSSRKRKTKNENPPRQGTGEGGIIQEGQDSFYLYEADAPASAIQG